MTAAIETSIHKHQRGYGPRVRFAPQPYSDGAPSATVTGPRLSPEEEQMRAEVRKMRDGLEQMKQMNRNAMLNNACPLLCADAGIEWPPPTHNLAELERVQPDQKGLASDGHEYDLARLKAYIRENMDQRLASPVTGDPIVAKIAFTDKNKTKVWTPAINGGEDNVVTAPKDTPIF